MNSKEQLQLHLERYSDRLERTIARIRRISRLYGNVRLTLFLSGLGLTYGIYQWRGESQAWVVLGLFLLAFVVVAYFHRRIHDSLRRHEIWLQIKRTHLARMQLDWSGIPPALVTTSVPHHPFAVDLDLIGTESLHQLIDVTSTIDGSQRLRDRLLAREPDADRIRYRQTLVREMRNRPLFRDKLILNATLATRNSDPPWQSKSLLNWLRQPARNLRPMVLLLAVLALSNLTLIVLYALSLVPGYWSITLLLYIGLYLSQFRALSTLFDGALKLESLLEKFRSVASFLESYRYGRCRHLKELCRPYLDAEHQPSIQLRRVRRIASAASLQNNPFISIVINFFFPWDLYFLHRLNLVKADMAEVLPEWLDVWFELEALNGLATLGGLNPHYTFPDILESDGDAPTEGLRARSIGHPLLPDRQKVCNDFELSGPGSIALFTGSNMSGKSTFLRTLGVNLALSFAGGPVDAQYLQTSLFRLFTCINVSDSVIDGLSYFYAEVKRLKALLTALESEHAYPLFFLIDEIFRGTNNRERFIGSQAYLKTLAGRHGMGAVSTHDLELVHLKDELPMIHNYHFRESVTDGRMTFDYRLHTGPCPTTNALKIMAMEGLPINL